ARLPDRNPGERIANTLPELRARPCQWQREPELRIVEVALDLANRAFGDSVVGRLRALRSRQVFDMGEDAARSPYAQHRARRFHLRAVGGIDCHLRTSSARVFSRASSAAAKT